MIHRQNIQELLDACALEILDFIKQSESQYPDRWVPIAHVKNCLDLNMVAVPQGGVQYGPKGWVFASLARRLEDQRLLEHTRIGSRSFCRSARAA
jgi:hypothetical protein